MNRTSVIAVALSAAAVAAVTTAASVTFRRRLHERRLLRSERGEKHLESWENEGGALAPQHVAVETSQVAR